MRAIDDDRAAQAEARLTETYRLLGEHREGGGSTARFLVRHPRTAVRALTDVLRLPRLTAELSGTTEGAAVRAAIGLGALGAGPLVHRSVLRLPDDPAAYSAGPSRQTVRRKVRQARALGVRWRAVDDPAERRRILAAADGWERGTRAGAYRNATADNHDLLAHRLWLVAFSADGRPLLLSVTPYDGEWAWLRHFRTIGSGDAQSLARYLMTQVLAEELVGRGVRVLLDAREPAGLPNGLRHFQRMVGFRIVRVRAVPTTRVPRRVEPVAVPAQRTAPQPVPHTTPAGR
jgi:hypothetical protein